VDLGLGAIAHVVDELDLRAQEVGKTALAVEEHFHLRGRGLLACGLEHRLAGER
jgi:hypothetical protein